MNIVNVNQEIVSNNIDLVSVEEEEKQLFEAEPDPEDIVVDYQPPVYGLQPVAIPEVSHGPSSVVEVEPTG